MTEMTNKLLTLPTPCYVIDEARLTENLEILQKLERETGCHVLLAQKCYSCYYTYPLIRKYISGATASGLFEARLGHEEMRGENHIFSPAYSDGEFDEILTICDHIIFNSFAQLAKYREMAKQSGRSFGIRINPECSTQEGHAIYDPCAPMSRLGVTAANFRKGVAEHGLDGVEGLHFHTLCEQNSDDLAKTLNAVEEKFGEYLPHIKWLNFGGGHHITRADYDIELLKKCILRMREKYGVEVYIEPGEAVALNAGYLVAGVLEIVDNGGNIAILDASAACHMPDVIEMPYRPNIVGAGLPNEKPYTCRFGGNTCLAGDIIGDYSFDKPLSVGDKLIFEDMAIYSMVKNNTFNGMALPSIYLMTANGDFELIKSFGYEDFKARV